MTKISRKQNALILLSSTAIYLTVLLLAVIPLVDKSYILKSSDIFKIDSVKILSRAYYLTHSKNSSKSTLEFEDLTLKTFRLESLNLDAPEDLKTLYDTLQYSKTVLTIYTDKEGLENYRNQNNDSNIPVLNISIGDKSFGNLNAVNANSTRKLNFQFNNIDPDLWNFISDLL